MIDIRQSLNYANYLKREGWTIERIEGVNYFLRKLPILGYVLKIQRPEKIDFDTIDKLCRKYRVFQILIEPKDSLSTYSLLANGYKLSHSPYLPTKTLQIDLTRSSDYIFQHFKKDARQAIRRGSDLKIKSYSTNEEIKIFRNAWKNSVKFTRYVPSYKQLINLRKSFPQAHSLFLASHNISGRIIGGVIFTTSSHDRSNYITYYWQAFTNNEGRSSLSQYSLLWQGILWAKKNGSKIFDFEGIYDPRFPNKTWAGFTHFKRSFGGSEVSYPGAYTLTKFPFTF